MNSPWGGAHRRPLFRALRFEAAVRHTVAREMLLSFRRRVTMASFFASVVRFLYFFDFWATTRDSARVEAESRER